MKRHSVFFLVSMMAGFFASTAADSTGRLGCYEDHGRRVWKQSKNTHEKNTPESCRKMCQDFRFAGVQYGYQCMCGDEVPPKTLPDSRCNKKPCPGDPGKKCGGVWAMDVYHVEPKPAMLGNPMGCFQDGRDRVWKTGKIYLQNITPQRCFDSCRGFRYAGLEYGSECFCGDSLPLNPLPKSSCQTQCNSFAGKTCGGFWALDVFELSETLSTVGSIPVYYKAQGYLGIYKFYAQRKTWDEAWEQCESDEAHLVIINSEEEAAFVRGLFAYVPSEKHMHAGFHDLMRRGVYRTLFGEPLSSTGYTVWSPQHGEAPSSVQHCGSVDSLARLEQVDGNCGKKAVFVCEKKSDSPDANGQATQIDIRDAFQGRIKA